MRLNGPPKRNRNEKKGEYLQYSIGFPEGGSCMWV